MPQRNKNAAFYFPYIEVVDPAKQLQDEDPARIPPVDPKYRGRLYVPPSGHIAGIYARTDEERGVHKAPANAAVLGALNVKYYVSKPKQELLNPQGVNCIRNMNGNITVWGARTIGGDKNARVEIHQCASLLPLPARVYRRGNTVGGVRAQRPGAVGQDPPQRERVLDQRMALRRAVRPHTRGGVLRQM